MQLSALLRFTCWLTPVGCSTLAVMVSHGVGGCLVTVVLFPPLFFFFVPTQLPLPLLPLRGSAPLQSGLACLSPACWSTPRVGLEGSGCVLFLMACSVRCFSLGVVCWAYPAPLACGVMWTLHPVSGCSRCGIVCWVCRWGSPAAFSFP